MGNREYRFKREALTMTERKSIEKFLMWVFLGEPCSRDTPTNMNFVENIK